MRGEGNWGEIRVRTKEGKKGGGRDPMGVEWSPFSTAFRRGKRRCEQPFFQRRHNKHPPYFDQ